MSCNAVIKCDRCFKKFTSNSDLVRHMNRRYPCDDNKENLTLLIKLEEAKIKLEEIKLKQAKLTQTAGRDINNNNIVINNNIQNINNYIQICNREMDIIENIPVPGNIVETIYNLCKDQYNNSDVPENKCIVFNNGKLYAFNGEKLINYNEFKPKLQKQLNENCADIIQNNEKLTDNEMITFNIPQRKFMENDKISILKKVPLFVSNIRNNGVLKNQLKRAVI